MRTTQDPDSAATTICVLGSNSGRNAGDAAILSSIIHNVRALSGNVRFEVPVPRKRNLTNRFPPSLVRPIPMMPWHLSLRFLGWTTMRSIARSDVVLITDGIIFDVRFFNPFFNFLILLTVVIPYARLLRKRIVCFLVGVGPLTSALGKHCARIVCSSCDDILVREPQSKTLLEEVGIPPDRIGVFADAAFLTPPAGPARAAEILAASGVPANGTLIGLNVNDYLDQWLEAHEGLDPDRFRPALAAAIDWLVESRGYHVVMLLTQHMDRRCADRVLGLVRHKANVTVIGNDRYTAEELMAVMGAMKLFVGMRLHSLILAATMGIPCIGLAYAPKVQHFMDLLETPDALIELAEFSVEALEKRVATVEKAGKQRVAQQASRVNELRELARAGFDLLVARHVARQDADPTASSLAADR